MRRYLLLYFAIVFIFACMVALYRILNNIPVGDATFINLILNGLAYINTKNENNFAD